MDVNFIAWISYDLWFFHIFFFYIYFDIYFSVIYCSAHLSTFEHSGFYSDEHTQITCQSSENSLQIDHIILLSLKNIKLTFYFVMAWIVKFKLAWIASPKKTHNIHNKQVKDRGTKQKKSKHEWCALKWSWFGCAILFANNIHFVKW